MSEEIRSNQPQPAYVLRVTIAGSKPPIWRELSVPADCTLESLHRIIQIAFDWGNDHLHSFTVNSVEYTAQDMEADYGEEAADGDSVCLYELNLQAKQKFSYLYDFGDSWEHEIKVSKIIPPGEAQWDLSRPRCLGGRRAGPLEDSGGIWGYESMLEILKDPHHKDYETVYEWAGDIDPEYFSLEDINALLEKEFKSRS
jgi:hypothetical protein